jgi:hypothetical protein
MQMAPRKSSSKRPSTSPAGYRSAGTGRFVKKSYATKHPKTTVKETKRK